MNIIERINFSFRYSTSASSETEWAWCIAAIVIALLLGTIWGKLWNKSWSLTSSMMLLFFFVLPMSLIAGYATLNLFSIKSFDTWLEKHRKQLVHSVTTSGKFNRDVFSKAWEVVSADSDQKDLLQPNEGGLDLRLNDSTDASNLAGTAALKASETLQNKVPFQWGIPFSPMLKEVAAQATVDAVGLPDTKYPIVVQANNPWTRTAATLQANHSLDAYRKIVEPGVESHRMACVLLITLSLGSLLIFIPIAALSEIRVNPKA